MPELKRIRRPARTALNWIWLAAIIPIWCLVWGHDWDCFIMRRIGGGQPRYYRCCIRCEKSEEIDIAIYNEGAKRIYGNNKE